MRTRRSPRNQEILWRALGGSLPTPPKRLRLERPVSRERRAALDRAHAALEAERERGQP